MSALRGAHTLVVAFWRAIPYTALRLRSPRLVCHEMLYEVFHSPLIKVFPWQPFFRVGVVRFLFAPKWLPMTSLLRAVVLCSKSVQRGPALLYGSSMAHLTGSLGLYRGHEDWPSM